MKVCYIKYKLVIVSHNNILVKDKINLDRLVYMFKLLLLLAILLKTIKKIELILRSSVLRTSWKKDRDRLVQQWVA